MEERRGEERRGEERRGCFSEMRTIVFLVVKQSCIWDKGFYLLMFLQKGIGCAVRFCIVIISFYREGRRISLISGFAFLFLMLPTFCIEVQYSCRERGRWLSNWIEKPLWPNLPTLLHPVEGISKSEEPIKKHLLCCSNIWASFCSPGIPKVVPEENPLF